MQAIRAKREGRFFQEQNLNTIVEVGDEFPVEVEENYCWMTLNQMLSFVIYNNYLNIAARSLLSAISYINRGMTNTKERLSYISVLRCIVVIVVVFGYAICIQANGMFSERSV